MQKNLILRHQLTMAIRRYFDERGFLEIETPILTKSTPEGARDYLVPSRVHPGEFFALPQSPQIFKQILMIGGLDRYFQIVKCFRDEDLRADRQPEFTQVDVEISFASQPLVFSMIEPLIAEIFKVGRHRRSPTPFRRMPYSEAMARYGSDKPDLRFGMEIQDLRRGVCRDAVRAGARGARQRRRAARPGRAGRREDLACRGRQDRRRSDRDGRRRPALGAPDREGPGHVGQGDG